MMTIAREALRDQNAYGRTHLIEYADKTALYMTFSATEDEARKLLSDLRRVMANGGDNVAPTKLFRTPSGGTAIVALVDGHGWKRRYLGDLANPRAIFGDRIIPTQAAVPFLHRDGRYVVPAVWKDARVARMIAVASVETVTTDTDVNVVLFRPIDREAYEFRGDVDDILQKAKLILQGDWLQRWDGNTWSYTPESHAHLVALAGTHGDIDELMGIFYELRRSGILEQDDSSAIGLRVHPRYNVVFTGNYGGTGRSGRDVVLAVAAVMAASEGRALAVRSGPLLGDPDIDEFVNQLPDELEVRMRERWYVFAQGLHSPQYELTRMVAQTTQTTVTSAGSSMSTYVQKMYTRTEVACYITAQRRKEPVSFLLPVDHTPASTYVDAAVIFNQRAFHFPTPGKGGYPFYGVMEEDVTDDDWHTIELQAGTQVLTVDAVNCRNVGGLWCNTYVMIKPDTEELESDESPAEELESDESSAEELESDEPEERAPQVQQGGAERVATLICRKFLPEGMDRCTDAGQQIATNLVRVAATRIFAQQEQSIMEPIVNSLDAYSPQQRVGKFGMGFFSLLSWVARHGYTLFLRTAYKQPNGELSGYAARFFRQGGDIYVETMPMRLVPSTGTDVELSSPGESLTFEEFIGLVEQVRRLKYSTAAQILVNQVAFTFPPTVLRNIHREDLPAYWRKQLPNSETPERYVLLNTPATGSDKKVFVTVHARGFRVVDKAGGIPWDVFNNALIVPSVSSKTIQLSVPDALAKWDNATRVYSGTAPVHSVAVTVAGVSIVTLELEPVVAYEPVFRMLRDHALVETPPDGIEYSEASQAQTACIAVRTCGAYGTVEAKRPVVAMLPRPLRAYPGSVLTLSEGSTVYVRDHQDVLHVRLDLPPFTRVPVSRDNVYLQSVASQFRDSLQIALDGILGSDVRDVALLERALRTWSDQVSDANTQEVLANGTVFISDYLARNGWVCVDPADAHVYFALGDPFRKIVAGLEHDSKQLEETIASKAGEFQVDTDVVPGRTVLYTDAVKKVTPAGSITYVWVPDRLRHKDPAEKKTQIAWALGTVDIMLSTMVQLEAFESVNHFILTTVGLSLPIYDKQYMPSWRKLHDDLTQGRLPGHKTYLDDVRAKVAPTAWGETLLGHLHAQLTYLASRRFTIRYETFCAYFPLCMPESKRVDFLERTVARLAHLHTLPMNYGVRRSVYMYNPRPSVLLDYIIYDLASIDMASAIAATSFNDLPEMAVQPKPGMLFSLFLYLPLYNAIAKVVPEIKKPLSENAALLNRLQEWEYISWAYVNDTPLSHTEMSGTALVFRQWFSPTRLYCYGHKEVSAIHGLVPPENRFKMDSLGSWDNHKISFYVREEITELFRTYGQTAQTVQAYCAYAMVVQSVMYKIMDTEDETRRNARFWEHAMLIPQLTDQAYGGQVPISVLRAYSMRGEDPVCSRVAEAVLSLTVMLDTVPGTGELRAADRPIDEDLGEQSFPLSAMTHRAFTTPTEPMNAFLQRVTAAEGANDHPRLQTLEIAINEGSTKTPVHAKLTELIQNSVDAMRQHAHSEAHIDISLRLFDRGYALSVSDPVGIPWKGIVAMSIPFLSSKTAGVQATGEMGTGFFNVYRESTAVRIDTTGKDGRFLILDRPVEHNGRVVEVNRQLKHEEPNSEQSPGTMISMKSEFGNENELRVKLGELLQFVRTVLCWVTTPIRLNDELITREPAKSVVENGVRVAIIGETYDSQVFTMGIPFSPLAKFLSVMERTLLMSEWTADQLRHGVLLDFQEGSYEPTQTRDALTLSAETQSMLRERLYDTIYDMWASLETQWPELFENYSSTADIGQAMPYKTVKDIHASLRSFAMYYKRQDQLSFVDVLWVAFKAANPERAIDNMSDKEAPEWIRRAAKTWVKNKTGETVDAQATSEDVSAEMTTEDQLRATTVFTAWVNAFWTSGTAANITGFVDRKPPPVKIRYKNDQNLLAWYTPADHAITVNTVYAAKLTPVCAELITKSSAAPYDWTSFMYDMQANSLYTGAFGAMGTLCHECEHARQGSKHDMTEGAHGPVTLAFGAEDVEEMRDYNHHLDAMYTFFVKSGFLQAFRTELNGVVQQRGGRPLTLPPALPSPVTWERPKQPGRKKGRRATTYYNM